MNYRQVVVEFFTLSLSEILYANPFLHTIIPEPCLFAAPVRVEIIPSGCELCSRVVEGHFHIETLVSVKLSDLSRIRDKSYWRETRRKACLIGSVSGCDPVVDVKSEFGSKEMD